MSTNQRRVNSGLATAQFTVTAVAQKVFVSDVQHLDGDSGAINQRWLAAAKANAGTVFFGPAGVTALTGDKLDPGERIVIAGPSGAGYVHEVYVIGTQNDIVSTTQF